MGAPITGSKFDLQAADRTNVRDIKPIAFDAELATIKDGGGSFIRWRLGLDKIACISLAAIPSTIFLSWLFNSWATRGSIGNTVLEIFCTITAFLMSVGAIMSGSIFIIVLIEGRANPFAFRLRTREERQYLAAVKSFLKNKQRGLPNLRERVRRFNQALSAFKKAFQLLGSGMTEEVQSAATESLDTQRRLLAGEIDDFFGELKTSLSALQERRELVCKSAEEMRLLESRRKALKKGVTALKQLYADLPGYDGGTLDNDNVTRDLSPYIAADQMRERLETEREELGLPSDAIPPAPKSVSRLKAKPTTK